MATVPVPASAVARTSPVPSSSRLPLTGSTSSVRSSGLSSSPPPKTSAIVPCTTASVYTRRRPPASTSNTTMAPNSPGSRSRVKTASVVRPASTVSTTPVP